MRDKDWSPTIYTIASKAISTKVVEAAYYQIKRTIDELVVVAYGTGSGNDASTKLSYDSAGNYFDFETTTLTKDKTKTHHTPFCVFTDQHRYGFYGEECGKSLLDNLICLVLYI